MSIGITTLILDYIEERHLWMIIFQNQIKIMYLTTVITVIDRYIFVQVNMYLDISSRIIDRYVYLGIILKWISRYIFRPKEVYLSIILKYKSRYMYLSIILTLQKKIFPDTNLSLSLTSLSRYVSINNLCQKEFLKLQTLSKQGGSGGQRYNVWTSNHKCFCI